jgi:hypothetical protein
MLCHPSIAYSCKVASGLLEFIFTLLTTTVISIKLLLLLLIHVIKFQNCNLLTYQGLGGF